MENQQQQQQQQQVDEKGVPFENRLKEMERKLTEKFERDLAEKEKQFEAKYSQQQEEPKEKSTEDMTREELMALVKGPKAWLHQNLDEWRARDEVQHVQSWFQSQKDYTPEANDRIMAIEREYGIGFSSPLQRARAVWDIYTKEKAAKAYESLSDDAKREAAISKTADGGSKSVSKEKVVTRADLIKKLAQAESSGDLDTAIKITEMLEDIR